MILYHPLLATDLASFGIDLPLRDDRSDQVFRLLKKDFPNLSEIDIDRLPKIFKKDLERVHHQDFLKRWWSKDGFLQETLIAYDCQLKEGNSLKPFDELRESILRQVAGTYQALLLALENQFCFYLGGGMHHGRSNFGSGFCPLNDLVIATRKAQEERGLGRVLILDVDAHLGDGTAEITEEDENIDTYSIHMKEGWPFNTELKIIPSTLDHGIGFGEENQYLKKLHEGLDFFYQRKYEACFVVAGADPFEGDELPSTQSLNLSKEDMLARDLMIYKWCQDRKLPQAWVMAGGYGKNAPGIYAQFLLKVLHLVG